MGANPKAEWIQSHFLPYQTDWIYDPAAIALANKSRQIGFSDGTAGRCIVRGLYDRRPQVVISAAQKLADELLETVRTHCEILAALGNRAAVQYATNNSECIEWRSGGRVIALASSARTSRSFHGDVYFDEFAFHEDPEKLWSAAAPMASNGDWQLRVISTPNGGQGLFYDWVLAPPAGWSIHRVTVDDAERMGKRVDRAKLLQLVGGDERLFGEAYLCQFLDANLQYIPTALADAALAWPGAVPDLSDAELHAGLDVGREHDLTVLTVLARHGRRAYVLAVLTCKRTDFAGQKKMIDDARRALGWASLTVDASGLGTQLAEELVERYGADEVHPVVFTAAAKQNLATRVLRWLRDGRLRFSRDAEGRALHGEAIALRRKVSTSGNVQYVIPRTRAGHGDRFWSMALGLAGADGAVLPRGVGAAPVFAIA